MKPQIIFLLVIIIAIFFGANVSKGSEVEATVNYWKGNKPASDTISAQDEKCISLSGKDILHIGQWAEVESNDCIMLYQNRLCPDERKFSFKAPGGGGKVKVENIVAVRSFRGCSGAEKGPVNIQTFAKTGERDLLGIEENIKGCRNLKDYGTPVRSIDNMNHCIFIYEGRDCSGDGVKLAAGTSRGSKNTNPIANNRRSPLQGIKSVKPCGGGGVANGPSPTSATTRKPESTTPTTTASATTREPVTTTRAPADPQPSTTSPPSSSSTSSKPPGPELNPEDCNCMWSWIESRSQWVLIFYYYEDGGSPARRSDEPPSLPKPEVTPSCYCDYIWDPDLAQWRRVYFYQGTYGIGNAATPSGIMSNQQVPPKLPSPECNCGWSWRGNRWCLRFTQTRTTTGGEGRVGNSTVVRHGQVEITEVETHLTMISSDLLSHPKNPSARLTFYHSCLDEPIRGMQRNITLPLSVDCGEIPGEVTTGMEKPTWREVISGLRLPEEDDVPCVLLYTGQGCSGSEKKVTARMTDLCAEPKDFNDMVKSFKQC